LFHSPSRRLSPRPDRSHTEFHTEQCRDEIRLFLVERLGPDFGAIDFDTPLLDWGLLDSITMQVLLGHIENRYSITVPPEVVKPETFGTIRDMAAVVQQQRTSGELAAAEPFEALNVLLESYGIGRRWVDLPAARQHILECPGTSPPLLLLPGLGSPASSWGNFLRSSHGKRRAFALDLPGFRISDDLSNSDRSFRAHVDNAIAMIEQVVRQPCVLVGHSAGGMIAAEIARRRPDLTRAMIIVSFGRITDGASWWRELHRLSADPAAFWQRAFRDPPPLTDALRTQLAAILDSPAYHEFLDRDAVAGLDRTFAQLALPTLFVGGLEDRIVDRRYVEAAARQVPGAHTAWIPRCGHSAPTEKSEEILVYVEHFLRGALGSGTDAESASA